MAGLAVLSGNVVKLAMQGTLYGQEVITVLHFVPVSDSDTDSLDAAIQAGWIATSKLDQTANFTYLQNEYTIVQPAGPASIIYTMPGGLVGTQSTNLNMDPAAAIVVTKRTALAGRRFRGRIYLASIPTAFYQNGSLVPANQTTMQTHYNSITTYFTSGAGSNWTPVVYHDRIKNPLWQPNSALAGFDPRKTIEDPGGFSVQEITTLQVEPIIRSQRRREVGRGR